MKKFKKLGTAIVLSLTLVMAAPMALPAVGDTIVVEAATIKLNQKTASLAIGKTVQLKLTGTKSKITWTSSEKTVAAVDQKGKVTAKKAGKATITATANSKKYTCVVTIKGAASTVKTPYKSKVISFEGFNMVIPESWKTQKEKGSPIIGFYPSNESVATTSTFINAIILPSVVELDYDTMKEVYVTAMVKEAASAGLKLDEKDIKTTKLNNKLGTAMKVNYTVEQFGDKLNLVSYLISTDKNVIQIIATDADQNADPSAALAGEYMYQSLAKEK